MALISPTSIKRDVVAWLRQGTSPQRLALTLALGFAIGCIPVVGIPTVLCAALAMALRLNLPAIQAANYLAMPLQLFLIVPFVRMGGWLFAPDHGLPWQPARFLASRPSSSLPNSAVLPDTLCSPGCWSPAPPSRS